VTDDNDNWLWLWDPLAGLALLAREGRQIEVAPGDVRTVGLLTLDSFQIGSGLQDGQRSSFNDAGQFVFAVFFTDDSIAILRSTPIVPEPAAIGLVTLAAFALRRR